MTSTAPCRPAAGAAPPLPPGPALRPEEQAFEWFTRPYEFLDRCARQYGDVFTLRFPGRGTHVFFSEPEALREILTAPADVLSPGAGNVLLRDVLGPQSIFALDGEAHLRQRKACTPWFAADRVAGYADVIRDEVVAAVRTWPVGEPFPVQDALQDLALAIIIRLLLGPLEARRAGELHGLVKRLLTLLGTGGPSWQPPESARPCDPRVPFQVVRRELDCFLADEFAARCEAGDGGADRPGMWAAACGAGVAPAELSTRLLGLLIAGHETTATSLAWALYWVHATPGVAKRLCEELAAPGAAADPADAAALPYLDAVCRETLRVCPVVPAVPRVAQRPLAVRGVALAAGVHVNVAIYLAHRRADVYDAPDTFRPERFLERSFSPYEYLPFGGGARRCLGMHLALSQMKAVLALLLSRFSFRLAARRPVRPVRRSLTVGPSEGLPVVVSRRP